MKRTMRHLLIVACGLLLHASLVARAAASEPAGADSPPPNLLFVLIDDMGYADLGSYGSTATTPNLDRLADEGLRFTQFYVNSPICSPSRTAFLTGQYPQRWGITSFINDRQANERRGMAQWLDRSAPSVARLLQENGYATGHFGKWHLGGGRDVGEAPLITEYGFDESLTQFEGLGDRILPEFDKHDGSKPMRRGLETASEELGRGQITWMDRSVVTQAFAERAGQFIQKSADAGTPFYVQLWLDDVHTPLYPPGPWDEKATKRERYLAVVEAMDQQLGPLFDLIRETEGLRDNTIILIASDNGPEGGAGSAGPFRGTKGALYEGGIREPLIVWAPGLMAEQSVGGVNEQTVIAGVDFLPSILGLAGLAPPDGRQFDGINQAPALLGQARPIRQSPLFWRRPPDRPGTRQHPLPDLAIRDGDWKLLCMADGSEAQLYHLPNDPGESENLAESHPQIVTQLKEALLAWNAEMPRDNPQSPK